MNSIIESLWFFSEKHPQQDAFVFLPDGVNETARLTYQELLSKSLLLADHLRNLQAAGSQALLLFPSGLDYIISFWACLLAGVTAVPAYPPRPGKPAPRIERIAVIGAAAALGVLLVAFAIWRWL